MHIAVITNTRMKEELMTGGIVPGTDVSWLEKPARADLAACYIDLLFSPDPERLSLLQSLQPALVIVNAVSTTLEKLPQGFIRFNGWPGFLKRAVMEASAAGGTEKKQAEEVAALFNRSIRWVPDKPGFITARVVAMIINEAFYALQEKVSTREEIDTAMKGGTNYPYGPFEWCKLIGPEKILELLNKLTEINIRYQPCSLLATEKNQA